MLYPDQLLTSCTFLSLYSFFCVIDEDNVFLELEGVGGTNHQGLKRLFFVNKLQQVTCDILSYMFQTPKITDHNAWIIAHKKAKIK